LDGADQRKRITSVTLAQLRAALTDHDIESLLDGTYNPDKRIEIERVVKVSKFAEDCFITSKRVTRKPTVGKVPKKVIPLSKRYERHIREVESGRQELDEKAVLGYYFLLYKQYFREEDPEWSGTNTHPAELMIYRMAVELTECDYRKILIYLRKIFPLWIRRLKGGSDFPNNRPTVQSLFAGKRYFWTNRNILYKQWADD
jgi:hypothetical protein